MIQMVFVRGAISHWAQEVQLGTEDSNRYFDGEGEFVVAKK